MPELSSKPYLVRAIFEWCNDCGYTPYVAVRVGGAVRVPMEFVQDGQIVLNISPLATNRLTIGNDALEFQARFGGRAREIYVPIEFIRAVYARENGQGMAFDVDMPSGAEPVHPAAPEPTSAQEPAAEAPAPVPTPALAAVRPSGNRSGAKVQALPTRNPASDRDEPPPEPPAGPAAPGDRPRLTRVK